MKRLFLATITIVLTLSGCERPGADASAPPAPPPAKITVALPIVHEVTEWDEFTGRLAAIESVDVRARVSGYVESVAFKEGQVVAKGDLLYVIDQRPFAVAVSRAKAGLQQAKARYQLADNELERAQSLKKNKTISESEYDNRFQNRRESLAALRSAEAEVKAADLELSFTKVRAPISGRIGRKQVTEGNLVSGGSADSTLLTTIVSLDPIHVYVAADEAVYLRYQRLDKAGDRASSRRKANPVKLRLSDEDGWPHEGQMDFVDNRVDLATGTIEGRAIFPNPDLVMVPGLFADVRVIGEGPYDAVLIPDKALGSDQSEQFVYVIDDDDNPVRRSVTVGRRIESLRIVRDGVKADERIVINGLQRIQPGASYELVEESISAPESNIALQ